MDDEDLKRFSRQIVLPQIGLSGQKKLLNSKVLICGAGGLGSSALLHLAGAGVGEIGIVDFDIVDISNIHRQIIHNQDDVGKLKVISAKEKIELINQKTRVNIFSKKLIPENIESIFSDYDLIVDGLDNFKDKFLINDTCVKLNKKFIHAGVLGLEGQVMSVDPLTTVNLRSLFPEGIIDQRTSCREIGVLGTCVGIISTIQAHEAIKILTGIGMPLYNRLLKFDGINTVFKEVKLN